MRGALRRVVVSGGGGAGAAGGGACSLGAVRTTVARALRATRPLLQSRAALAAHSARRMAVCVAGASSAVALCRASPLSVALVLLPCVLGGVLMAHGLREFQRRRQPRRRRAAPERDDAAGDVRVPAHEGMR